MPYIYTHKALSGEARAARPFVGVEDQRWVVIQINTFTNWVNEQLAKSQMAITNVQHDFADGTVLIALVELLQQRRCTGRIFRENATEFQCRTNVQMALDALQEDGVKLVNIGSHDIVEGNSKLILGLLWCLILRYQIAGKTRIPPRKLMLAWLQAVIPEFRITNFTRDWNDGMALTAVLNYCQPGVTVGWRTLKPEDAEENCRNAMQIAKDRFGVPMVLSPEDMASPNLDDLSCMTYLSYFMKRDSPGYNATLAHVKRLAGDVSVTDFTRDWNDGIVLCSIVHNLGGYIPGWPNLGTDPTHWIKNLNFGISGSRHLGVDAILSAQEMAENETEHLSNMAYAARLCNVSAAESSPVEYYSERCHIQQLPYPAYVNTQVNVDVIFVDSTVRMADLEADVSGQNGEHMQPSVKRTTKGALLSFFPLNPGQYQVRVYCAGDEVKDSPSMVHVLQQDQQHQQHQQHTLAAPHSMDDAGSSRSLERVSFTGLSEPCAIGSIVEVVINAHGSSSGQVLVEAASPSGSVHKCQVIQKGPSYTATFTPTQVGEWQIAILYDGEHIRGSPFSAFVYDANLVQVYGLDVGVVGQQLNFNVNTAQAGRGDIKVNVLHHGRAIASYIDRQGPSLYKVQFTPDGAGQYKIHIYFNNMETKGSPFILDIVDASSVSVYGDNLRMASVDKLSTFMIHAVGADTKDLGVNITAPSGIKKRATVTSIGEHHIDVRVYDQRVSDSPYTCNVGDPNLVSVRKMPTSIHPTKLGETHSFEIDVSAAGSGNLEIMINGGRVACKVQELGNKRYLASFVPMQALTHTVHMKFNGEHVRGSPWRMELVPGGHSSDLAQSYVLAPISSSATYAINGEATTLARTYTNNTSELMMSESSAVAEIEGVGLSRACVNKTAAFDIGAKGIKSSDIDVHIYDVLGREIPCRVLSTGDGNYRVEYSVSVVGDHRLDISIADKRVPGSPFVVSAYDPNKVHIEPINNGSVGKPVQFIVDANEAGKGQLEISINGGRVPNSVQMQGTGRCLVTFIPQEPGVFIIDVSLNYELVKGCPVRVEVQQGPRGYSAERLASPGGYSSLRDVERSVNQSSSIERSINLSSSLASPSKQQHAGWQQRDDTLPKSQSHQVTSYHERVGSGSGQEYDASAVPRSYALLQQSTKPQVEAVVKPANVSGTTQIVTETRPGGVKTLTTTTTYQHEEIIERSSRASNSKEYKPTHTPPPDYATSTPVSTSVSRWIKEASASPSEESRDFVDSTVQSDRSSFAADNLSWDPRANRNMATTVASYDVQKSVVKSDIDRQMERDRSYDQRVNTWEREGPIRTLGSPDAGGKQTEREVIEIQAPIEKRVSDQNLVAPTTLKFTETLVETKDTNGKYIKESLASKESSESSHSHSSQSSTEREVAAAQRGRAELSASPPPPPPLPQTSSTVRMQQSDSAVTAEATIQSKEMYVEPVIDGPGIGVIRHRKATFFDIKPIICDKSDLRVTIIPPSKQDLTNRVHETRQGFVVEYTPREVGTHRVHIKVKDKPLAKSPYTFKVYDPEKILVSDIKNGNIGKPVQFTVDASSAGYGNLEIAIKDDREHIVPSNVTPHKDTSAKFMVSFVPEKIGLYMVHISFNGEVVGTSPFECFVSGSESILEQITDSRMEKLPALVERPLTKTPELPQSPRAIAQLAVDDLPKTASVDQITAFIVQTEGQANVTANVRGPKDQRVPTKILDTGNNQYRVEFVPTAVGDHEVSVRFADVEVQGSPFMCRVYDARRIRVGNIPTEAVGTPVHFVVDASEAGVGNLEVAVNEGRIPSMAHSLGNHRYDISFVPRERTDHTVSIKFNNEAVPGSPFICKILSVSAVSVSGTGLERVPVKRAASFNVEVQGASNNDKPVITVKDSTGQELPVAISAGGQQGTFRAEYTPQIVGNHTVNVSYAGGAVTGSPFTAKAFDASRVKLHPVEGNMVGKPNSFYIDAAKAGAGNMEIIVSVENRNVPNFVQAEGNAKFKVSFTPLEAKRHTISVKFNGDPVPGSPMETMVMDGSECVANGQGLSQAAVNKTAAFVVDTRNASDTGELNAIITGPNERPTPSQVKKKSNGNFEVQFIPTEVGPHHIAVTLNQVQIGESPFVCNAFDPNLVTVSKIGPAFLSKPVVFDIDFTNAGEGTVEVEVRNSKNATSICQLKPISANKTSATFIPNDKHAPFWVLIRFNGEVVPGCPIRCDLVEPDKCQAFGDGLKMVQVGATSQFHVDVVREAILDMLEFKVKDPAKGEVECAQRKETATRCKGQYLTQLVGLHYVHITCADQHIPGSPFPVQAFDLSAVKVIGLVDGQVGQEVKFSVDYSTAGEGYVDLNVTQKGHKVRHSLETVQNGMAVCTFTPKEAGKHKINVSFNGFLLPECPYETYIRNSDSVKVHGTGATSARVRSTAHFTVLMDGAGRGELDVIITAPKGDPLPVRCFQQKDGNFRVEYSPSIIGVHTIDVTFSDRPVAGSPFACEVFDPSKCRLNPDFRSCILRQETAVLVSRRGAGKAELSAKVTDPSGKVVPHDVVALSSGDEEVKFVPTTLGQHQLSVTFGGYEVPNSPLPFSVEESGKLGAYGEGLQRALVHEPAHFFIDPKKSKGGLKVEINGPNQKLKHSTGKKDGGVLDVAYTPVEVGYHKVNVQWNNKLMAGSPYEVPVVDPSKVRISSDSRGAIPLVVNKQKMLPVDASEAGPGHLRAEVRGPSGKVPVEVDDLGLGKYRLSFTPLSQGDHSIYLYWSEFNVPSSPIHGYADIDALEDPRLASLGANLASAANKQQMSQMNNVTHAATHAHTASTSAAAYDEQLKEADHLKVILRGEGLRQARTKEQAEFIIDGSEAGDGIPSAAMLGQKADVPVQLNHLGNNVWQANYTPLIAGSYQLQVLWSERPVRGCPFKVSVQASGDASRVVVDAESLKMGIVGQEVKTSIDTRQAGPGKLMAQCIGPNKLAYCELYDHKDGTYTLCIKPVEVGKHTLIIKYSDEHVPGSPYTLYISNPPDPSKVRVYGPGVEHGILSRFKSNFLVETKGAGAGQLTVRVRGPKGAFVVEMQREKKNDRTIQAMYQPKEPGDYQIEVKWAGEHVPNSPFLVMIFDTQQELERYMSGQPPSPGPQMPFLPPGWVGPPPPGLMMGGPMMGPPPQSPPLGPPPQAIMPPPPNFPHRGHPYASSTIYSTNSSKHNKFIQNGY